MGYISSLPIHFQNLTSNSLPNMILRKRNVLTLTIDLKKIEEYTLKSEFSFSFLPII
jgi:hypothetical protein